MQDATMFSALAFKNVSEASKGTSEKVSKDDSGDKFSSALQRAHSDTRDSRVAENKQSKRPVDDNAKATAENGAAAEQVAVDNVDVPAEQDSSEVSVSAGSEAEDAVEPVGVETVAYDPLQTLSASLEALPEADLLQIHQALQAIAAELQAGEQTPEEALAAINRILGTELPSDELSASLQAWLNTEDSISKLSATEGSQPDLLASIAQQIAAALKSVESIKTANQKSDSFNVNGNNASLAAGSLKGVAEQNQTTDTAASTVPSLKPDTGQAGAYTAVLPVTKGPVVLSEALITAANGQVEDGKALLPDSAMPASALAAEKAPLTPALRGFTVQTAITPTVGNAQWGEAVGQKVLWLAKQNISFAQLRLDPPDLGPMQIRIQMQNDQAHVSFVTHQPHVREVLDQNLLRLREMFNEQGIDLVDVDVSDQSQQSEEDAENSQGTGQRASMFDQEEIDDIPESMSGGTLSLVDHYA